MAALQVTRAAYALGAQITGIDLRDRLTDADIAGIRRAVLDNLVVCFPRQEVDQAALLRLGQAFGEIEPASKENVDPDAPTVTLHKQVRRRQSIQRIPKWAELALGPFVHDTADVVLVFGKQRDPAGWR